MERGVFCLVAMVAGGGFFGVAGTIIGLLVFFAPSAIGEGRPLHLIAILFDPKALYLAAYAGGPPAIGTGIVAPMLKSRYKDHWRFAWIMALVGAIATALYAVIMTGTLRALSDAWFIGIGAIAAFCCALPYGFWLRAK